MGEALLQLFYLCLCRCHVGLPMYTTCTHARLPMHTYYQPRTLPTRTQAERTYAQRHHRAVQTSHTR